jgi:hypothetical protein
LTTVKDIEDAGPIRRGLVVWYGVVGGLAAWTVHLVFEAAVVRWTFDVHGYTWILHAATVICGLATLASMWVAWRLRTIAGDADESSNEDAGQLLFLGNLGLLFGTINLLLIILEGVYAAVLYQPHALR